MTDDTIHTCSYYCERPECVRRQRDELRDRMESALAQQQRQAVALPKLKQAHPNYSREEVQWVFGYNAALDDVMRLNQNTALSQQPAAVNEAMVELARKARQLQRDHFGDGMSLHLAMMGWAEEYDALATQHQEPTT